MSRDTGDGRVVVRQLLGRLPRALRHSASASAGLPICNSRTPRFMWHSARTPRKSATVGIFVRQLLNDRQRLAALGLRLRRLAHLQQQSRRSNSRLSARFLRKSRDGGVFVHQLLVRSPAPCGIRPPPPPACPSATARCRGKCGWPPGRSGTRRRRGFRRPASDRSPAPCGTRAPPPRLARCTTAGSRSS